MKNTPYFSPRAKKTLSPCGKTNTVEAIKNPLPLPFNREQKREKACNPAIYLLRNREKYLLLMNYTHFSHAQVQKHYLFLAFEVAPN